MSEKVKIIGLVLSIMLACSFFMFQSNVYASAAYHARIHKSASKQKNNKKVINTFLKYWFGNTLVAINNEYKLNYSTKIYNWAHVKKNKKYKPYKIGLKLIYINGILKNVIIKRIHGD